MKEQNIEILKNNMDEFQFLFLYFTNRKLPANNESVKFKNELYSSERDKSYRFYKKISSIYSIEVDDL